MSSDRGRSNQPAPSRPSEKLDWLSDFVIPAAVFGLLGTLLYFLIDLRQYLVGGEAAVLRYIVFWFLIGVIGLARLSARPRSTTTPPIIYATALAVATGLAVVSLSPREGAMVGAQRVPGGAAAALNLLTVAGLWAAAWFLTGVCTRPEHALEELRSGGITSARGYAAATAAPLRAILVVTALAAAIFGYGLAVLDPSTPLRAHAFFVAGLFLLFALLLMALVSLGAARLAAHREGLRVQGNIIAAWLLGAAVVAVLAVALAAAMPQVASRIAPRPPGFAEAPQVADGSRGGVGVSRGASSWPDRLPGGVRQLIEPMMGGGRSRLGASPHSGGGHSRMRQMVPITRRPTPTDLKWLLLTLALIAAAAAWWQRRRIAAAARAAGAWLRWLAASLAALLARLLRRPAATGNGALPRDPWADIFEVDSLDKLDPALAVRHVWRALQLYYEGLGLGRRRDETEVEFARRAVGRFAVAADDVRRVALLFCACEYGGVAPGPEVAEQMREVWARLAASVKAARQGSAKAS